jgi:hypothetical protein
MCVILAGGACGCSGHKIPSQPEFSYNGSTPFPAVVGEAIALTPAASETIDRFSVDPALPAGLSLNRLTGVVSGTPTSASAPSAYTITATNARGRATFRLVLSVAEPPRMLSYRSPVQVTVGTAIAPLIATVTGSVDHYAILPTLPAGLVLDSRSGTISGTPTIARNLTLYTITASSLAGGTSFVLLMTVIPSSSQSAH